MVAVTPRRKELGTFGEDPKKEKNKWSAPALGAGRWSRGQALGTWRYEGPDGVWDLFAKYCIFITEY
jgi:hypothetical protein